MVPGASPAARDVMKRLGRAKVQDSLIDESPLRSRNAVIVWSGVWDEDDPPEDRSRPADEDFRSLNAAPRAPHGAQTPDLPKRPARLCLGGLGQVVDPDALDAADLTQLGREALSEQLGAFGLMDGPLLDAIDRDGDPAQRLF